MESVLVPLIVFFTPVALYWLRRHYNAIEKGHVQKQLPAPKDPRVDDLEKEKTLLAERVANLESIICSVDLELNQRLNRLALESGPPSVLAPRAADRVQPLLQSAPSTPHVVTGAGAMIEGAVVPAGGTLAEDGAATAIGADAGFLFGRYKVERELGRGGMGAVFLAEDTQLKERVAVKVVSALSGGDPAVLAERFRREASAARRVTHPNVIRIFELGESRGDLYLSMEFFPGMTLEELLRRRGALPLDEARTILRQVCDGLAAAHQAGVIHRDLKPGNILVGAGNAVKIIDFGIAKAGYRDSMTATGLILGTPDYMAPEQVRGREVDLRADIYALGAVAYRSVEGRAPFIGDTPIAVGFAHCTQPVVPPARAGLPPRMQSAIVKALAKDPRDRFVSVEEMKKELLA